MARPPVLLVLLVRSAAAARPLPMDHPGCSPLVAQPRSATPQMPNQDAATPNAVPTTRRTTTTADVGRTVFGRAFLSSMPSIKIRLMLYAWPSSCAHISSKPPRYVSRKPNNSSSKASSCRRCTAVACRPLSRVEVRACFLGTRDLRCRRPRLLPWPQGDSSPDAAACGASAAPRLAAPAPNVGSSRTLPETRRV
jgi:hypothetical protein